MRRSVAIFIALLVLGGVIVAATAALVYRLTPAHRRRQALRWLLGWSIQGVLAPVALWTVMNVGISWDLQPFMPQVQALQNSGGKWHLPFLRFVGFGIFVVTSYWAATTLGWVTMRTAARLEGEQRDNFKALCWTCVIGMLAPSAIIQLLGGWPTLGLAAMAILVPLAAYAPTLLQVKNVPPMYARAVARIKFGKYAEAEIEIIRELEKCEDDFEGWVMLAELYATHFHDLEEAEQTILEVCDQPRLNPSQLSVALHRLADWHLKLGADPDAARRALQMICLRLPGTHLARMAQLRINQLPETPEELREQQNAKPIPLPALHDTPDDGRPPAQPQLDPNQAVEQANGCVALLTRNPNNVSAREKLARLFAEQLNEADRGIEQLMLLLDLPDQEDAKRAEWLALAAIWHIQYRQDAAAGREMLERIIREFPHCPQAAAAQRRLQTI
jgi:hypothetical protein